MNKITDYSNRTVDINLLSSIVNPTGTVEVSINMGLSRAKVVTGIQKLIQKYTLLFLSIKDAEFNEDQGTDFIPDMLAGIIQQPGSVPSSFAFANADVVNMLKESVDDNTPEDEQIQKVRLQDYSVDYKKGLLYLNIRIITKSGDSALFVLPTNAVIK